MISFRFKNNGYDRRGVLRAGLGLSAAALLGACSRKPEPTPEDEEALGGGYVDPKLAQQEGTLEWAVTGDWRNSADKQRDRWRHPIETLRFFGVEPRHQVVEIWPGSGYMSEIIIPWLAKGKGLYTAALFETQTGAANASSQLNDVFRARFGGNRKLYGEPTFNEFGTTKKVLAGPGTQDCVLMLLVIQDMMAAGLAEDAFAAAFAALKPGGILGIEQHRADIGNVQDPAATNGYVQEPFVQQLATEAGFQFVSGSDVNTNPRDDKNHPFGVWTLPPQRLTAPRGEPANPEFDGTLYESIGESDRMTLKFRKPA